MIPEEKRYYLRSSGRLTVLFRYLADHGPARVPNEMEVARLVHWSLSSLKRNFPHLGAGSWRTFLRVWRMRNAVRLLRDPFLNISEVARLCGYRNVSSFDRAFRCAHGATPMEYRLMLRETEAERDDSTG